MEAPRNKSRGSAGISARKLLPIVAAVVALAIIIGLCISISRNQNMQRKYTAARNRLGEAVYENLYMMVRRGEELTLAGADVQGTVLPAMRDYFIVGRALNEGLAEGFGARYAVLDADQVAALESGFDAYDAAFKGGRATGEAQTLLIAALAQTEEALSKRYDDVGHLKPAS